MLKRISNHLVKLFKYNQNIKLKVVISMYFDVTSLLNKISIIN